MIFRLGAIRPDFRYGKIGLLLLDVSILLGLLLAASSLLLAVYILLTVYCSDFWVLLALSLLSFFVTHILSGVCIPPYRQTMPPVFLIR
jgi:hypothetical protein